MASSTSDGGATTARTTPTVVLAVSGSIAAYKAVEVARALRAGGARVIPVMTHAARAFVGAVTLSGITREKVHEDMFDASFPGELHVDLARRADLILLVPATADLIARLAAGRADDLVAALALCANGPVMVAPAMHPRMWSHPATQRNVAQLAADGRVELIGPVFGEVASGERGMGRLVEPVDIAAAALARIASNSTAARDLAGHRVVVTAGPTVEDLDPVRFIGNRSTGKMGFAVAQRAASRGAAVTLITGPVALTTPPGVRRIDVRGTLAMREELWRVLGADLVGADALVMTAAVADYRPAEVSAAKRKRSAEALMLELVPNPDLLAEIGEARGAKHRPALVGFAVETDTDAQVVAHARYKLAKKRVDLVVANHASDAFGKDDNRATIVGAASADALGRLPKLALADEILDRVARLLAATAPSGTAGAGLPT